MLLEINFSYVNITKNWQAQGREELLEACWTNKVISSCHFGYFFQSGTHVTAVCSIPSYAAFDSVIKHE